MAGNKTLRTDFHLLKGLVNNDDVVRMGLEQFQWSSLAKPPPAFRRGTFARSPPAPSFARDDAVTRMIMVFLTKLDEVKAYIGHTSLPRVTTGFMRRKSG